MKIKIRNIQTIIIIIMGLVIVFLVYHQWGERIIADIKYGLTGSEEKEKLWIGEKSAKLKIIEYYSYGCEYCTRFEEEIKPQIFKNYVFNGKVRWVFRPLDPEIGMAVLCANEQGKFAEYHNSLFSRFGYIEKAEDLKQIAENLGLNVDNFWRCYSSDKYAVLIIGWYKELMSDFSDQKIAEENRGTPAFLIGDEIITGIKSYVEFSSLIEKKLKEQ